MQMEKVERVNIGDRVFEQMRQMILTGQWQAGDRIPSENELVRTLGVSRVSVRAAIHQLVGMGVLTVRHGDGTFVSDPMGGNLQSRMMQQMLLTRNGAVSEELDRLMARKRGWMDANGIVGYKK